MISRAEAKKSGAKFYESSCKRCGYCTRRVDSGSCISCSRERRKRVYDAAKSSRLGLLFEKYCNTCAVTTMHYSSNGNCKICANKISAEHYLENRKFYMDKFRANYSVNREDMKRKNREWYQENKSRLSNYYKQYREDNSEKIKAWRRTESAMAAHRKRQSDKYKTADGKAAMAARNMVYRIMTGYRCGAASSLLGYSTPELVGHISSLFTSGMSWDNYGEWHIDHIIPVSFLLKNGIRDVCLINSLKNLMPLWATDNIAKKDNYEGNLDDAINFLEGKC